MRKIKYLISFLTILVIVASCTYNYEWLNDIFFDYRMPPITSNGDYSIETTVRASNITIIDPSTQEIAEIVTKKSWVEASGNFKENDVIEIHEIIVNKNDTIRINYKTVVDSDERTRIYFENDEKYNDFAQDLMNTLQKKGYVRLKVTGYLNAVNSQMQITLCNDINIHVRE